MLQIKIFLAPNYNTQVVIFQAKQVHSSTLVKISHLVASLPTSCQQLVFAMLVPSCQQVWNKLLTISNNPLLILMIRLVTQLFQQVRYSHDIAVLLQPCVVNLVTFLFIMTVSNLLEQLGRLFKQSSHKELYKISGQYININRLFVLDFGSNKYTRKNTQVVTNLQQTCSNAVPTTCQQDVFALLVPSLLTSCERLVDNLLQGC